MNKLSSDARKECLFLARKTLHEHVRGQQKSTPYQSVCPELQENAGAFVTLKYKEALRGCIGYIQAVKPLAETIVGCTISAASQDPRFPPIIPGELPEITIEISVLSPLREITDLAEIEVGRHGILISKGFNRGLLLPQVATEYGWDREQFLSQTCVKAGLSGDSWHKGVKIEIFTAEVFGETEPPKPA